MWLAWSPHQAQGRGWEPAPKDRVGMILAGPSITSLLSAVSCCLDLPEAASARGVR